MITLIVHGGAWDIPNEMVEAHKTGVKKALNIGWEILKSNRSSVDAVEHAITVIDLLEVYDNQPQLAAEKGIDLLHRKVEGFGGVIILNKFGKFGVAFNTPRMARAYINSDMDIPFVSV